MKRLAVFAALALVLAGCSDSSSKKPAAAKAAAEKGPPPGPTQPTLKAEVERTRRLEEHPIPQGFPYEQIGALKVEARQKLSRFRPATVGQASRIAGVTAADIAVLLVHLKRLSSSKSH